jgi:hypothetical protein
MQSDQRWARVDEFLKYFDELEGSAGGRKVQRRFLMPPARCISKSRDHHLLSGRLQGL